MLLHLHKNSAANAVDTRVSILLIKTRNGQTGITRGVNRAAAST